MTKHHASPAAPSPYPYSTVIPYHETSAPISDWWNDERGQEDDASAYVEALFTVETDWDEDYRDLGYGRYKVTSFPVAIHTMIGATIEYGNELRFIDRETCLAIFGEGRVGDIENRQDEIINADLRERAE